MHSFARHMSTSAVCAVLLASHAVAAPLKVEAPAGNYKNDPTHTSITWKVNHLGLSHYTARFTKMDATLSIDPAHPEQASVKAVIDPASIRTDFPYPEQKDFDKELATSDQWLNDMKFPAMVFTSTKVERTGDSTAKLYGTLNLLGVNKPVVLDVTYNGSMKEHPYTKTGAIGFSATGSLKRSDFGMTNGLPFVGDEVNFAIETEFFEQTPEVAKTKEAPSLKDANKKAADSASKNPAGKNPANKK